MAFKFCILSWTVQNVLPTAREPEAKELRFYLAWDENVSACRLILRTDDCSVGVKNAVKKCDIFNFKGKNDVDLVTWKTVCA